MNQPSTTWKVQNPSLILYAFQLRQGMSQGNQEVMENADQLWEQCVTFGEQRQILILKSLKSELLCYTYDYDPKESKYRYNPDNEEQKATAEGKLDPDDWLELIRKDPQSNQARQLRFHTELDNDGLRLMGEIYPLRIHDTYALDLTLRYRETVNLTKLSQLNPTDHIQASLGQTLLLFTKPINSNPVSPRDNKECSECDPNQPHFSSYPDLANHCVAALFKDTAEVIPLAATGQLFGSPIFEYDNDKQQPKERRHVLVWFDSHPETVSKGAEAYYSLLNLLCCRSKIIYAYDQSRRCHEAAREISSQLEQKVEELVQPPEETLEDLEEWLRFIPQQAFHYAKYLRDMEDHSTAINTNMLNYTAMLEKIQTLSLPDDNLTFCQNFLDHNCKKWQKQIEVDLNYLKPSQHLFDQMSSTIRGIIEVKQTESDRDLQKTLQDKEAADKKREKQLESVIAGVGTGLTISGISSQVASNPSKEISPAACQQPNLPFYFACSLVDMFIHIAIAVPVGILVWLWQKPNNG
ncbi:MAG: hypothetical protein F6K21_36040 [Symploca sp. SIO2D2]|nr:hypothetical protein [Symploca sp. SIO2D2]